MPFHCGSTDNLRKLLLPFQDSIRVCFAQGLTVAQCAAILAGVKLNHGSISLQELNTIAGRRAIREVFSAHLEEKPEPLFPKIVSRDGQSKDEWLALIKFIHQHRRNLLTWVPAVSRLQIEDALGFTLQHEEIAA